MKSQVTEQEFWLEKPKTMGIRGWSLLVPSIASAIGFFAFAVLAFGFTELDTLPQAYRKALVLTGAFSLAFGSEVGTLSSVVEIYRKGETLRKWDRIALVISIASTVCAFILAFATLLNVKATWSASVKLYFPILLGLLSGLDSYSNFLEFGLYLNGFDGRMRDWTLHFQEFKRTQQERQLDRDNRLAEQRFKIQLAELNKTGGQVDSENVSTTAIVNTVQPTIEQARTVKGEQDAYSKAQRFQLILDTFRQDGHTNVSTIADRLNVSRTTVYGDMAELRETGQLVKNGKGYIVTGGVR